MSLRSGDFGEAIHDVVSARCMVDGDVALLYVSWMWWCLMSMKFLRFVGAVFLAAIIAAFLSIVNSVGLAPDYSIFASSRRSHCVCRVAREAAKYLASHVDVATVDCVKLSK